MPEHPIPALAAPYLSYPNRHGQRSQLLIEGDQHAGLHGSNEAVENVVGLAQDNWRGDRSKRAERCPPRGAGECWGRGTSPQYSLLRTSRKDTRTVSSPATATWLMSWRSLWYGHRVSVPLPRWVRPWCGREST